MEFTRGSEWRKWDLHVHTPCSLVQEYGGNTDEAWERFLSDLESLPEEFGVIGINDYIFVDGYRKVLAARKTGRLSNIKLILPVVELRLDKFGGSRNSLARVNFHVIFSDEISPELIEQQFLGALSSKYQLSPECAEKNIRWSGVATRDSLTDLGQKIIDSVPENEHHKYGSPLQEGFNNLNLKLSDIQEVLRGDYFEGRALTAVGKTEWDAVNWNGQSIAEKKNIINSADFVFIAAESPEAHTKARTSLTAGGVKDWLLDCSDAHRYSGSVDKDRIGNCFTWVKADLTFSGLKQTIAGQKKPLYDSPDRFFIGDVPPQVLYANSNPTKFIQSLSISRISESSLSEHWFNGACIQFNTGLVAIIGNKGSGKSALVDVLGLLGDARQQVRASFLNRDRFNTLRNSKAAHFEATLSWASGTEVTKSLNDLIDPMSVERVKYIPQNFFEAVCNEISKGGPTAFDSEIKEVIFSHVPDDARLGKSTLNELIAFRTSEIERSLSTLRVDMARINKQILDIKDKASESSLKSLQKQLIAKQAELTAHIINKPSSVADPALADPNVISPDNVRLAETRKQLAEIDLEIETARTTRKRLARLVTITEQVIQKVSNLKVETTSLIEGIAGDLENIDIPLEKVVTFTVDQSHLSEKDRFYRDEKTKVDNSLDKNKNGSLISRKDSIIAKIEKIQTELDEPSKQYQSYLKALREWDEVRANIQGATEIPGSLSYIEDQIDRWSTLPVEIRELEAERLELSKSIFLKIVEIRHVYADLYKPVQDFIAQHSIAKDRFRLNFDVSIAQNHFHERFFSLISQSVIGSFCGREPGAERLRNLLDSFDFDSVDGVIEFLNSVEAHIRFDQRKDPAEAVDPRLQVKTGGSLEDVYNLIFGLEYLTPKYRLQMAGKNLDQLSPGEKGSLLLVFYLLVDQNDTPLLIDQPEENLDNQTVVSLLVPSIRLAKQRRQIFIVTHNPNLAVVCDAEQIIYASHESDEKTINYKSGSIENPEINRYLVDVLEGTKMAFDNRGAKYTDI